MTPAIERFWDKTRISKSGCWLWTAAAQKGYGVFHPDPPYPNRVYAHRWAYEQFVGPIPEGLQLDHLCRVTNCVNPDHLDPCDGRTNRLRGETRRPNNGAHNRVKTHCPQGHPYDEPNTGYDRDGSRYCRTCKRLKKRERDARRRATASGL
jgi:hypothetical protein